MSEPFVGEIRLFGGNFAPAGWAFCDGRILPISENDTLFNLIGTTYGGDGQETFALPDLQGRVPIHAGQGSGLSNRNLAEKGGVEQVTLTVNQIPSHNHIPMASDSPGNSASPTNSFPAVAASTQSGIFAYGSTTAVPMKAGIVNPSGGSQPHDNMMPYIAINYIISLYGIYPTQT